MCVWREGVGINIPIPKISVMSENKNVLFKKKLLIFPRT